MQFSQGQLRATLGISVETFRHWKRVLPPFSERKRYTPGFSIGDLLAAGILHHLTVQCGIRVGYLPEISKSVVEICNVNSWALLESKTLVVDVQKRSCRIADRPKEFSARDVIVLFPLSPIMSTVQDRLSRSLSAGVKERRVFRPTTVGEPSVRRRRA